MLCIFCTMVTHCIASTSFVLRPLLPEERPGILFAHARTFWYIFHKKLRALHCLYAEDYTNQEYRAFFEIHSTLALI